ncbi:MAG: ribosome small subunit-dependent GTPase A [Proteobacteria bacterium]|nr:ribosome small subunit-dependent GTPase A [Pseudomonadota bacterium]HQR04934.1 ribosome small subunit-dependent GTPase A [Rhodocyclaceae bacterium]
MARATPVHGTVIAAFGRHYEIALTDGRTVTGFPRGKKSPFACGDEIELDLTATDQGQILRHGERRTLLYRSDEWKQKLIAANATQLVLVTATEPAFSDELLGRCIAAAEHEGMRIIIVLNKCDLVKELPPAQAGLALYESIGYPVLPLSAVQDATPLRHFLRGETSVLVGQSGMGKSTLINTLVPGARAATREISQALNSGKHTTTHARLYTTEDGIRIIDSPGLQEFGLAHLNRGELEFAFREFRPYLGHCRFRDCQHEAEPDCALKDAALLGSISAQRLELFRRIAATILTKF